MNNFASHRIEKIIVENVKTKVSVKATSKEVSQLGADDFLSKADFVREAFLPAIERLNNGYNLKCVCYAAKVLASITDNK